MQIKLDAMQMQIILDIVNMATRKTMEIKETAVGTAAAEGNLQE